MSDTIYSEQAADSRLPAPRPAQPLVLAQSVQAIDRSVKERNDVDHPLMNWWLAYLIVIPFTFSIYQIVLWFRWVGRVDRFRARKERYYNAVGDFTAQYAESTGRLDAVSGDLRTLKQQVDDAFALQIRPINAGLCFVLSIVTLGIWALVVVYKLNKAWYTLMVIERNYDEQLSKIWQKLGLLKYPLTFNVDATKQRSYVGYLVLSVVTLSIWWFVWLYKIHTDPDRIYAEFHGVEDTVLQTVRAA